jgi:hypothetical protein
MELVLMEGVSLPRGDAILGKTVRRALVELYHLLDVTKKVMQSFCCCAGWCSS